MKLSTLALVPWRDWKEKQGFEIDFFAIEEIGTRAKDVKKFLHRLYKKVRKNKRPFLFTK